MILGKLRISGSLFSMCKMDRTITPESKEEMRRYSKGRQPEVLEDFPGGGVVSVSSEKWGWYLPEV